VRSLLALTKHYQLDGVATFFANWKGQCACYTVLYDTTCVYSAYCAVTALSHLEAYVRLLTVVCSDIPGRVS
jgi:hypothetical protein